MSHIKTFGVHFVIRSEREREGKSPVYARIVVNKSRSELSLKFSVSTFDWDAKKGKLKAKSVESRKFNIYLDEVKAQLVQRYLELQREQEVLTADGLKKAYLTKGENDQAPTLLNLIALHGRQMKEVLKAGTMKNYYTTEKYLKIFLKTKHSGGDVFLSKLDFRFITDFEFFLRMNPLKMDDPCTTNGIMKHLERLKKLVAWGLNLGLLKDNPFKAYKLKFQSFERGYLDMAELEAIAGLNLNNRQVAYVRDLFVFACYTGLSYADTINLKSVNLETDIDGVKWINTIRQKSKLSQRNVMPVVLPLLDPAVQVIESYREDPRTSGGSLLFPHISNQEVNRCLKIIAGISGINKNITFHLARHTFATTVTLNNGIPIESVSKMLGHTKISTTQIYAKVMRKKLAEEMGLLKDKLLLRQEGTKGDSKLSAE